MSRDEGAPKKACCMISELLEEAGIDRGKVRALRRQVLEGVVLFCQWQLQRMDHATPHAPSGGSKKARKVRVD